MSKLGESYKLPPPPVPHQLEGMVAPQPPADEEGKAEPEVVPERVSDSHVWLFPGVNREHRWIQLVREAYEDGEGEDDEEEGTTERATEAGLRMPDPPSVLEAMMQARLMVPPTTNGSGSRSRSRSPPDSVDGAEGDEKRPRFA